MNSFGVLYLVSGSETARSSNGYLDVAGFDCFPTRRNLQTYQSRLSLTGCKLQVSSCSIYFVPSLSSSHVQPS
jgi:hypothetical protein